MPELPVLLTVIKVGTGVLMVVLLSVLAEVVSPRFAGIISGYPLGAAISLFFIGFEMGPTFAAESSLYTMLGLVATLLFAYGYYLGSVLAERLSKGISMLVASATGVAGYFLGAGMMHFIPAAPAVSLLLPTAAILLFLYLFRNLRNVRVQEKVSVSAWLLLCRALFAAGLIVLVTSTAKVVGSNWAGLFAAFPMTMLPLLVIIHHSYDAAHVHAILKSFPKGLGALVAYTLAVFICYPLFGIYLGTLCAYGLATLYLVSIFAMRGRPKRFSKPGRSAVFE